MSPFSKPGMSIEVGLSLKYCIWKFSMHRYYVLNEANTIFGKYQCADMIKPVRPNFANIIPHKT